MQINAITYEKVKEILFNKSYRFFTAPFNLNIVGIRTGDNTINTFNDFMTVLYTDDHNAPQLFKTNCTTDPGLYWLDNPENVKGTAIVKEGHYPRLWTIGMHHNKYKALVQVGPVTVYRDADRDANLDLIQGTEETGMFGINLHRANPFVSSVRVDKWSAGCQVIADPADFQKLLSLVDSQVAAGHGNKFSYTLIHERGFG